MVRGRKRLPRTLQELAATRVGLIRSMKVVTFIVSWGIACEAIGQPLTLEEYADWWKESRSTAFREQAVFREAFPGETTPQRIVDLLSERGSKWYKGGVKAAARISVAVDNAKGIVTAVDEGVEG
jgi:hypothetical protein